MGIVLKQGFWNSVWTYLGMAIGYFNLIVLFPNWMSKDEFGLTRLLLSFSIIVSQFAQFGAGNTIMKFFHEYAKSIKLRNVLLTFGCILTLVGVLFSIVVLFFGKNIVVNQYKDNASLFVDYYIFVFPLVAIITFFELFCSYLVTNLNSTLTSFLRECFFRICQTGLLVLFYYNLLDLKWFVILLIGIYLIMFFWVYLYLLFKYKFRFNFSLFSIDKKKYKSFFDYSFFILLSSSSSVIALQIDILMIGSMSINGLSDIAIYSIGIYISTVIYLPFRGANKIILPLVGKAFQEEKLPYLKELYVSTSVIFGALAGLFFVGIWCNMHNILVVLGRDYIDVAWIFFFLGIGKCYDMITGINDNIIVMSKYYRFSSYSLFVLMGLTVLFNLVLIPLYGITGAAISTLMAIFINNTLKLLFIYKNFKMLPFSAKHIISFIPIGGAFLVGFYFPKMEHFAVDIILRSTMIGTVFVALFIVLKVSDEFNDVLKKKWQHYLGEK